jgi:3-oxoadipate enol-lactonase
MDAMDEADVGPAALVGFSLGGAVALWIVLAKPERVSALVLANTSAWMGPEAHALFTGRAAAVEANGVDVLVQPAIQRWFTPEFVAAHRDVVEHYEALLRQNDPYGYAAACRSLASFDLRDRLGQIRCPTLVLVGDRDQATPPEMARFLATNIQGTVLRIIGPTGHLANEECTESFNESVLHFLATTRVADGRVGR